MAIAGGPLNAGIVSPAQHQHAYDEHQQREEEEQFLPVDRLADGRACERADDAAPRIEKAAAPFDRPVACMLREPRGRVGGNRARARPDRYMRARDPDEIDHQRPCANRAATPAKAEGEADEYARPADEPHMKRAA